MAEPYYLDHHSTTPVLPEVVEAMLPYFSEVYGNPSAITHVHGRAAAKAVGEARRTIASLLGVEPDELFFTAGATESNNIALRGMNLAAGDQVVTTALEHKSVVKPLELLAEGSGISVTFIRPDREGFISVDAIRQGLGHSARAVSVIAASGEIGTIQPLCEIGELCRERGLIFHTDATQAIGKIVFDIAATGADLVSMSAHKLYGPKGIGALVLRKGTRLRPLIVGGGQEHGLRSGTLNVAAIVGFAKAMEIRARELVDERDRLRDLRNRLWDRLVSTIDDVFVHGPRELRLPGNLNISFRGVDSESLIMAMRRFSLSTGSACSAGERGPSPSLIAIGVEESLAMSSIRIGLGRSTTGAVVDMLAADLKESVERLRELTPG